MESRGSSRKELNSRHAAGEVINKVAVGEPSSPDYSVKSLAQGHNIQTCQIFFKLFICFVLSAMQKIVTTVLKSLK